MPTELDEIDLIAVNALLGEMSQEAESVVRLGSAERPNTTRTAFMRYVGQGHEIETVLPATLTDADLLSLRTAFEAEYRRQFSRPVPGMRIEILNWAVRVSTPDAPPAHVPPAQQVRAAIPIGHKTIFCDHANAEATAAVYDRLAMAPGETLTGPALIIEPQTTTADRLRPTRRARNARVGAERPRSRSPG